MRIVIVTGGFDPLHSGHVAYIKAARKLGDKLVVGVNSDAWLSRKKGRPFMSWEERATIVAAIAEVDRVICFNDDDNSAKDAIRKVRAIFPNHDIIFANGGDRTKENIPEMDLLKEYLNLQFVFSVGGDNKANSSSWILEEWKTPKTERTWGYYRVLHEVGSHVKLKELTVMPKTCLSMQRHSQREEFWFVAEGTATVYSSLNESPDTQYNHVKTLTKHQNTWIKLKEWHKLCNETTEPLKLIEIQYGEACIEEDIERL